MESLIIAPSEKDPSTPRTHFSAETGVCWIEGESFMEDASDFYEILQNWILTYLKVQGRSVELNFKLTYFNTSSSKAFLEILTKIKKEVGMDGRLVIKWHYPKNEAGDILIEGEELRDDTNLPFVFLECEADE